MTRQEFAKALELAKSGQSLGSIDQLAIFDGCAYRDFRPVHVTLENVAKLIRYQAQYLNGEWDAEELDQMANIARGKFLVIG